MSLWYRNLNYNINYRRPFCFTIRNKNLAANKTRIKNENLCLELAGFHPVAFKCRRPGRARRCQNGKWNFVTLSLSFTHTNTRRIVHSPTRLCESNSADAINVCVCFDEYCTWLRLCGADESTLQFLPCSIESVDAAILRIKVIRCIWTENGLARAQFNLMRLILLYKIGRIIS